MIKHLNDGNIKCAALDVYDNEPNPSMEILMHDKIALSPHIGASTIEAQDRIGIELATQINQIFNG